MLEKLQKDKPVRKPKWLKRSFPKGPGYEAIRSRMKNDHLNTVCNEARCPNMWECFGNNTATFLIMGPTCTRKCRFCAVKYGPQNTPDPEEPVRVAQAAKHMGLSYVVITSVTRDDLPDGGASCFSKTINELRKHIDNVRIEILVPDFQGNPVALKMVVTATPDVLNHNIETCAQLYQKVRPGASYQRSLRLMEQAAAMNPDIPVKSGMMLGLGESHREIINTFHDLIDAGCRILTLGQYLRPTVNHLPVERFYSPSEFDNFKDEALKIGFQKVAAGPLVRSSYHADVLYGL